MAEHSFAGLTCAEVADLAPAFVLGALEVTESDAVRRHLADCPEAHAEIAELHSVVPALFEIAVPVAPPAGLKDRILSAAAADSRPAAGGQREAQRAGVPARNVQRRLADEPRPGWSSLFRRPVWAGVSLAAALAVVALGVWNLQLQRDIDALSAYRQGVSDVLERSTAPGAQLALLAPAEGAGAAGFAAVGADGTITLVMEDLVPTTGTQVYETWLIAGGAAPVPIGEFTVASGGVGTFQTVQSGVGEGVVVALSLEPGPDSTTPTTVVALGQARAQAS